MLLDKLLEVQLTVSHINTDVSIYITLTIGLMHLGFQLKNTLKFIFKHFKNWAFPPLFGGFKT